MKKLICITLATLMLLAALTGCSGGGAVSSKASGSSDTPAAPKNSLEKILASGKIVMGTSPDFAPNEFLDLSKTGQDSIVGSDIELAKYIAEKLGVELEIQAMDFSAVTAAVQQGTVDMGISGFAWKADRAEAMDLSDTYNVGGYQTLIVRKGDVDKYKTAEDFSGVKVGAQNGSLQLTLIEEQLPGDVQIQLVSSVTDGIMLLINGKIDALGMSGIQGEQYVKNYPEIVLSNFNYEYSSPGNVICLKKGSPELLAEINKIVAQVNEENLYPDWLSDALELADKLGANS